MQQFSGFAGSTTGQIVLFNQSNTRTAGSCQMRNGRAIDAAADDKEVKFIFS
jgi:hypothetical protein